MIRWVTFYYDLISGSVSELKAHGTKEEALKHFNRNCNKYFQFGFKFKATKLPATYGYPFRKYCCISTYAFKKNFGISVSEALKEAENE